MRNGRQHLRVVTNHENMQPVPFHHCSSDPGRPSARSSGPGPDTPEILPHPRVRKCRMCSRRDRHIQDGSSRGCPAGRGTLIVCVSIAGAGSLRSRSWPSWSR
jgi:hypothetical protein